MEHAKLKRINDILSVFVVGLGLYIALIPALPAIQLWWTQRGGVNIPYSGELANASVNGNKKDKPIPSDNRLVIPGIDVNQPIKEGNSISVIDNEGVWRRPNSSSAPDKGNMVLAGHRFTYANPYGSFYHLDKLKIDDKLAIYWQGKEYVYKVKETKVVSASSVDIEKSTTDQQLTLYTCTPIWSAKDRLVIIAVPFEEINQ